MKGILLALVGAVVCLSGRAQHVLGLREFVNTPGLKNAAIGISVRKVSDGTVVADYRAEMSLTPASVVKLIPAWFALREKGENYRFRTTVYYTGNIENGVLSGDVIICGGGNPCLDSRYFPECSFLQPLAVKIQQAGIREVLGKIRVEEAGEPDVPGSWTWEDISNYYAALYFPFNYRDNAFTLTFRSGKPGSKAELVSIVPALPGITVNTTVTAADNNKDNAWIYGGPYSSELWVKGSIPAGRSSFRVKGAMSHPSGTFVNELKTLLKEKGIEVRESTLPDAPGKVLWTLQSPELKKIVYFTNKRSVNLFAEALGKLCGKGNWEDQVRTFLGEAGIDTTGIFLKDICGLSRTNAVPAHVFTDLLFMAAQQPMASFMASLPLAGQDGGLNGFIAGNPRLKNKLRAKTGSMSGVRGLSGYLTTQSGEQLAFTILINHYTCPVGELQQAVGKFLTGLL